LNYDDVPDIPEIFRHVIVEGAMYYCYMFRSNEQAATIAKAKFDKSVKNMRTITMNRYEYVRSTMIQTNKQFISGARIS
jgi:type II restriction/modification system DNA methylase subunit YeeA